MVIGWLTTTVAAREGTLPNSAHREMWYTCHEGVLADLHSTKRMQTTVSHPILMMVRPHAKWHASAFQAIVG